MVLEPVVRPVLNPILRAVQGSMNGVFSPAILFTSGEQGAWYDPSDINVNWRYNLLTYTEQFDNAAWGKFEASVSANTTTAPNGTLTADTLIESVNTNVHIAFVAPTLAAGTYTFSVFYKIPSARKLALYHTATNTGRQFDAAGVQSGGLFNPTSGGATVISAENGFYRASITVNVSAGTNEFRFWMVRASDDAINYTGDGTSGIFIWGAQLQTGSVATTYQQIVTPEISYLSYQANPILYQDSAGTTPVTAVEQPVGLMLDKSKNGVGTNGGYRYNLVLWTEDVSNGYWAKLAGGTSASATTFNFTTTYGSGFESAAITAAAGTTFTASFVAAGSGTIQICIVDGSGAFGTTATTVALTATPTRYTVTRTTVDANAILRIRNISGIVVTGATCTQMQLALATAPTTYQRVNATWYDAIPGNHAFQTTSTSRPTLRARYNLLTFSEQFDNAGWTKTRSSVTANATTAPDGALTADKLIANTDNNTHFAGQNVSLTSGTTYSLSVRAKAAEYSQIRLSATGTAIWASAIFNLATGAVVSTVAGTGATIQAIGDGWYVVSIQGVADLTGTTTFAVAPAVSGTATFTGDGTSGIFIWGAQLLTAADVTATGNAYQRIAAATDYATSNPVFRPYLAFDGSDDSMLTNSVDFSATDKMTVWAGVTKLSDAAIGVVAELSSDTGTNNGAFVLHASFDGAAAAAAYLYYSKGTIRAGGPSPSTYPSPIINVATGIGDISAPAVTLRLNGTQVATSSATQGTGNYGNYPLYIGRRGNASLPFNGRLTSLIVRGAQSTAAQISSTESWVNQRTGAAAP